MVEHSNHLMMTKQKLVNRKETIQVVLPHELAEAQNFRVLVEDDYHVAIAVAYDAKLYSHIGFNSSINQAILPAALHSDAKEMHKKWEDGAVPIFELSNACYVDVVDLPDEENVSDYSGHKPFSDDWLDAYAEFMNECLVGFCFFICALCPLSYGSLLVRCVCVAVWCAGWEEKIATGDLMESLKKWVVKNGDGPDASMKYVNEIQGFDQLKYVSNMSKNLYERALKGLFVAV